MRNANIAEVIMSESMDNVGHNILESLNKFGIVTIVVRISQAR